jgi:putative sterol carrier protein
VFETYLPDRFKTKPDLIAKVSASYKFVITGDNGGTWVVDLTQPGGAITTGDAAASCTITMTADDFVQMMNGKLNAQMAFMSGKLKVAGDMGLALKLQAVLG